MQLYNAVASVPESASSVDQPGLHDERDRQHRRRASLCRRPHDLPHLKVTDCHRDDGQPLTAAYSNTWKLTDSSIVVTFIGLPASTKMYFSVEYS